MTKFFNKINYFLNLLVFGMENIVTIKENELRFRRAFLEISMNSSEPIYAGQ